MWLTEMWSTERFGAERCGVVYREMWFGLQRDVVYRKLWCGVGFRFNIPGKKFEKNICKTCGDLLWILNGFGTYQTSGTQWLDSDKKVRPGLEPSAHLYYSERVTDSHNKDPLPKYLDFPKGFGGSDKTWSEEETKA